MTTLLPTRPQEAGAPPSPDLGDRALVDSAVLGDGQAFETLVLRYGPALHRYARRMLRDAGDVEEVVQDTFVAAWRQLASFRGDSSIQTWFFAICSRKIADTHRVKRNLPVDDRLMEPLVLSSPREDPFVVASNAEFLSALEAALAELPPRQRATWVLREIEAMSFVDVGTVLSLSPDAARGHHRRARATLGDRLARWR
ncbi:sigma-70 family RNA polymerase sigma factor [Mycobacterium sp. NPDC006124]|uniref:RNA polymerase sigma factor n=1 Tax=Mycobacterium sp. NPDC006124 TaxID=3156729 RepID=UPI0033BF9A8E